MSKKNLSCSNNIGTSPDIKQRENQGINSSYSRVLIFSIAKTQKTSNKYTCCWFFSNFETYAFIAFFLIPIKPSKPVPNNQTAPGTGTGAKSTALIARVK